MNGKLIGGGIVVIALVFGAVVYYSQEYGYYDEIAPGSDAAKVSLMELDGTTQDPLDAEGYKGIDADSSPLRYRACFDTDLSIATATETYEVYDRPTPLIGPKWFDCYDAKTIGADLEAGRAVAFLSQHNIHPGVDRVVALYPDGRAYVWHQLNDEAEK
ncbi:MULTISPECIES: DUF6446 family protein [Thioclava]|uniref:DUF6446 family protein n=1 Tax=Thioclava TaxID=285107 RepID=UPI000B5405F8|nr:MULTISPECIES: DUF6446 family protein [Thioclava]OWX99307.1 histidine kinase [Thioclava sp. IC9]OWY09974.1 histidine kinase [Thioclava sp. F42-5]OWY12374.1 histidine kinase [Thioclava sp. F34-6]PWE48658.1 histidine kinase [Thioclava sp. NG1]WGT49351.1 DUF6446 family protein [Thioclava nitratireducens]